MSTTTEFKLPTGDLHQAPKQLDGESTTDLPGVKNTPFSDPNRDPGSTVMDRQLAQAAVATLPPGVIIGDFKVEKKLGQGAMGEVYRATQISLERTVALKLLAADARKNPTLAERFTREAKTLGELDHPHIVKVLATGEHKGQLFAAMEFIDGQPLDEWLKKLKRLNVADALHVALVCAWSLQHAHSRGVIHRDVKPSNVLVSVTGQCKLADFGIAKMQQANLSMTLASEVLGTPEYMAPEQCIDARSVSPRSDIYSLGTMLYVMLTGELPFRAHSLVELVKVRQQGVFPSAKSLNADVPEKVDLVISKMLSANPEHRYASCDDVMKDLAAIHRHADALSFVGTGAAPVFGPWTSLAAEATKSAASNEGLRVMATSPAPDPLVGGEIEWFVHHKNRLGKSVVSKMLTTDLIFALEKKLIPPNAEVRATPSSPFESLVNHAEFHPVLTRLGLKIPPKFLEKKAAAASQAAGHSGSHSAPTKKRRKRRSEKWDLAGRVAVGLLATYGLIRGVVDLVNLWR